MIIDDQEAYSTGLAAAATAILKANHVSVQHESVNQKVDRLLVARDEGAR